MRFPKVLAALAATSLVASPALAAPTASKLSIANAAGVKSSTAVQKANNGLGGSGLIVGLLAAAAVIAGLVIALDDSKSN